MDTPPLSIERPRLGQVVKMNANPVKARQAKRRKRQAGSVDDAKRLLWSALQRAEQLLDAQNPETGLPDDALALRAVHAISQGVSAYAKVVEVGELEARIQALESVSSGPRLGMGAA